MAACQIWQERKLLPVSSVKRHLPSAGREWKKTALIPLCSPPNPVLRITLTVNGLESEMAGIFCGQVLEPVRVGERGVQA